MVFQGDEEFEGMSSLTLEHTFDSGMSVCKYVYCTAVYHFEYWHMGNQCSYELVIMYYALDYGLSNKLYISIF